jgi:hypothetical protein
LAHGSNSGADCREGDRVRAIVHVSELEQRHSEEKALPIDSQWAISIWDKELLCILCIDLVQLTQFLLFSFHAMSPYLVDIALICSHLTYTTIE